VLLLPFIYMTWIAWHTYAGVHPHRLFSMVGITPAINNLLYEDVKFFSRDGLQLSAWFVSREGGKAVIVVHGLGGSGSAVVHHATLLFKQGFAVLLMDLRAHGSSQGESCSYGLREANDVLGAVDYLLTRPDVDPKLIGAYGISLGAQAVLRAAAETPHLRAVALEGIGPTALEDLAPRRTIIQHLLWPFTWVSFKLGDFFTGLHNPEGTWSVMARLKQPVMLIAAGSGQEAQAARRLFRLAKGEKELWELPLAKHAGCFFEDPSGWQEKVGRFFESHLITPTLMERAE